MFQFSKTNTRKVHLEIELHQLGSHCLNSTKMATNINQFKTRLDSEKSVKKSLYEYDG